MIYAGEIHIHIYNVINGEAQPGVTIRAGEIEIEPIYEDIAAGYFRVKRKTVITLHHKPGI